MANSNPPQTFRSAEGFIGEVGYDILEPYRISEMDGTYFGFLDTNGGWYIMRMLNGTFRYVKGEGNYPTAWAGRATLTYDLFSTVFIGATR